MGRAQVRRWYHRCFRCIQRCARCCGAHLLTEEHAALSLWDPQSPPLQSVPGSEPGICHTHDSGTSGDHDSDTEGMGNLPNRSAAESDIEMTNTYHSPRGGTLSAASASTILSAITPDAETGACRSSSSDSSKPLPSSKKAQLPLRSPQVAPPSPAASAVRPAPSGKPHTQPPTASPTTPPTAPSKTSLPTPAPAPARSPRILASPGAAPLCSTVPLLPSVEVELFASEAAIEAAAASSKGWLSSA